MNTILDIDLSEVKGVLIDFDNTLYEYDPCHEAGLFAVHKFFSKKVAISYPEFLSLYTVAQKEVKEFTKNQASSHSRLLYFQKMIEEKQATTNVEEIVTAEDIYWTSFIKEMKLKEIMKEFLALCRSKDIKICLITDLTASVQFRKMMATGVDKMVDFVVSSEESGVEKPHSLIFSLALKKMKLSKGDVVMIGDDIVKDIDGANTFGIKAYLA
jgi:putative hydrolase of the HAD superfamily